MKKTFPEKCRCRKQGFTLPECVIALAVTVVVLGTMATTYLYAGKIYMLARTRFEANEETRLLMAKLIHDIRAAAAVDVGSGDANGFTSAAAGQAQQGTALQVYLDMSTNRFIRYYLDGADQSLKRVAYNAPSPVLVAAAVTNLIPFTMEDMRGNILTNDPVMSTVGVTVQCNRLAFTERSMLTNSALKGYERSSYSYQLATKVTPRTSIGYQYGKAAP